MHVRINDITYHIELAGAGRPLLLLHGFTGSAEAWGPHLPALARHRRMKERFLSERQPPERDWRFVLGRESHAAIADEMARFL